MMGEYLYPYRSTHILGSTLKLRKTAASPYIFGEILVMVWFIYCYYESAAFDSLLYFQNSISRRKAVRQYRHRVLIPTEYTS